jgi:hypothetical protein
MPRSGRPRDRHKEQFWRQTLQRFAASRLSATQFCRLHQLPLHSFWAWKRTLRLRQQPTTPQASAASGRTTQPTQPPPLPVFLPLQVQQAANTPLALPSASALQVLLPNGLRLAVPQHFDPDTLQQLLILLRGVSC